MSANIYDQSAIKISLAYIHGRIEAEIESFANSLQLEPKEFTYRVATLLLGDSERSIKDRMSKLPNNTTKNNKTLGQMEMDVVTHSNRPSKTKKLKLKGSGPKRYWASMTKEQRKAEMARRIAKRKKEN